MNNILSSIVDHTCTLHKLNKYIMLFHTYLDSLPLNLVYFVLENVNFVLENNISLAVGTMVSYIQDFGKIKFSF